MVGRKKYGAPSEDWDERDTPTFGDSIAEMGPSENCMLAARYYRAKDHRRRTFTTER